MSKAAEEARLCEDAVRVIRAEMEAMIASGGALAMYACKPPVTPGDQGPGGIEATTGVAITLPGAIGASIMRGLIQFYEYSAARALAEVEPEGKA